MKMYKAIAVIKDAYGTYELGRHETKTYKTFSGAVTAAERISSNVERMYPWYQTVEYEVYENGTLIEVR